MTVVHREELTTLCTQALTRAGAHERDAGILAEATVEAEQVGNRAVGVGHLFDYIDGYREGRIAVRTQPLVRCGAAAVIDVDAGAGLAQTAFVDVFDDACRNSRASGLSALWIKNSFTCGELGYYARRLAGEGLVAVATANSPALMSLGGSPSAVLGTNPLAYGIPRPGRLPVVIDQASSSTAFVAIRRAAETGEEIPAGWALGPDGEPTQDARAALEGVLLPFGGHRGGNIALLVEILATLSGAAYSLDAAPFDRGRQTPGIGVFLLAIDPAIFPGSVERIVGQLETLRNERGVRLPALELTALPDSVDIAAENLDRLRAAARV